MMQDMKLTTAINSCALQFQEETTNNYWHRIDNYSTKVMIILHCV